MKLIWAYITLIRAHNCLVAVTAAAVGYYLTASTGDISLNPFTLAAVFFVCAFGNIINDIHDIESDRINHPGRALPSGIISPERAKTLAFIFLLISLLLLIKINAAGCVIVVVSIILVLIYNLRLKHTAYWGNLTVSVLGGLTFLLGGAMAGPKSMFALPGPLIPAVFALLMHLGREIIKDIEDKSGDEMAGSRTAPVRSGIAGPLIIAGLVFAALFAVSLAVYFKGWFNRTYLSILIFCIIIPIVIQFIWLISKHDSGRFRVVSAALKIEMIAGLLALIMGKNY